jgi:hypothetical protein
VINIAFLSSSNITTSEFRVTINGLSGNPSGYSNTIFQLWTGSGGTKLWEDNSGDYNWWSYYDFWGCVSNTTYLVDAYISYKDPNDPFDTKQQYFVGSIYVTTLSARPSNWSWSYSIYSGGSVYNTQIVGGQITAYLMSYSEWNNFTSRINQFRIYRGLSNYSFTTVSSGSNCTPGIINEAVTAINAMGFSIPTVGSGNVPASVFIQMRDSLNSIT